MAGRGDVYGVPADRVDDVWAEVQPMVQRVLDKVNDHRWEASDVLDALKDRSMQLWLAVDEDGLRAMLITQLVRYPRCMECDLFMWAGKMTEGAKDQLAYIEEWARAQGCHYMSTHSRRGSAKFVGYTQGLVHTYRGL